MSKHRVVLVLLLLGGLVGTLLVVRKYRNQEAPTSINLRLESFALNLDPRKMSDTESRRVATLLHLGLVRVNQDGTVLPGVATEWKQSGSATEFRIQPGVTFTDGSPITPTAVKESLCASMQPTALYAWTLASIARETPVDGKSVRCTGIQADEARGVVSVVESSTKPWLLEALAGPGGWILKPGGESTKYGDVPGAGPFRITSVTPDSQVVLQARDGGALKARAAKVVFQYISDDAHAATLFHEKKLDLVEVGNPTLARLLRMESGDAKTVGSDSDRVRVLIFGRKGLAAKGYSDRQVRALMHAIDQQLDRTKISGATPSLATATRVPFPFTIPESTSREALGVDLLPPTRISVITEGDQYSDYIASLIPRQIGPVTLDYKGVDKGLLVDRIVKGDFDIASVAIEGTMRTPEFWISFFQPGSPFTVFGDPLRELDGVGLSSDAERMGALAVVAERGNWLGLIRERRVVAMSRSISGLRFTPSGQASYEEIGRE